MKTFCYTSGKDRWLSIIASKSNLFLAEEERMMKPQYSSIAQRFCIFLSFLVLLAGLCFMVPAAPAAVHATDKTTQCTRYVVPVHLSALDLVTYHVVSWLCSNQTPTGL